MNIIKSIFYLIFAAIMLLLDFLVTTFIRFIVFPLLRPFASRYFKNKPLEPDLFQDEPLETDSEFEEKLETLGPGNPDDCWIPPGKEVTLAGLTFDAGMIYVGEHLAAVCEQFTEPALIDPNLPVALGAFPNKLYIEYMWTSYATLSPRQRGAYLEWLAGGRKDPDVNIGVVLLFFQGIERRCIGDPVEEATMNRELPLLLREVARLREIYDEYEVFRSASSAFLDLMGLSSLVNKALYFDQPPSAPDNSGLSMALKVGVAQAVADEAPLPADWALAWLLAHPDTKLRTPAKRCRQEFAKLFTIRYRDKFGKGIKLRPSDSELTFVYTPQNETFSQEIRFNTGLCDIETLHEPINRLHLLAEACQNELDAYSRLLGRYPKSGNTPAALALLPDELQNDADSPELRKLRSRLRAELKKNQSGVISGAELLQYWPTKHADRMLKSEAMLFCRTLERWGIGLEPDPRFNGAPLKAETKAALFRLPANSAQKPSAKYLRATILLHLAAIVTRADGSTGKQERHRLGKHVTKSLKLASGEKARLSAHLRCLLADKRLTLTGMKKRIGEASEAERRDIGWFLIDMAAADGMVRPGDVDILARIYKTLGLDVNDLHSHIHEVTSTQPVPAAKSTAQVARRSGKKKSKKKKTATTSQARPEGVVLDMEALKHKMEDTAKASAILGEIFAEEEEVIATPPPAQEDGATVAGLDAAHSALLKALAAQPSWSRAEFEQLAARWELPPEGALENLNDAAWDVLGEPLFEDEETLEIDQALLGEMLA